MPIKMYRGRTQSLFKFLPRQTFNWQQRQGSFIGTEAADVRDMDVPRVWIGRALRRLIEPFVASARQVGQAFPGVEIVERGQYELLEPRRFRGEVFPRTYVCLACDQFIESDDRPGRVRCSRCRTDTRVEQWSFVEFHRCGYISGLRPPQCGNGCRRGMRLVNRQSRKFGEWIWRCTQCGTNAARGVYHGCPECRRDQVRILRADANPVFYPQYAKVVNPPSRADYPLLDTDAVYPAAVAQSLGQLPPGLDGLRQALNDVDNGDAETRARRQLVEEYGLDEDDPMLDRLLERRRTHTGNRTDWRAAVDALQLDNERVVDLGHQCLELTLAREAAPITLDELIAQAPAPEYRALYDLRYREVLTRYGFAEATLLREFPLAYVVAGYTRESRSAADPGVIFSFFPASGGLFPMYGQRTETEALLFRLDPERVLRWLVRSGAIDDPGNVDPRAWLFSVMEPIGSIFEAPAHRITAAVLGLVHSISHRTLKAVAIRSGLSPESLSEYLLPHNLAFLIYADTRSEFVLGGLEHVYRNYLADSLETMDADRRCVFDPPCRNHSGACAFCMYLSENSCERFNTALSRRYLFGGDDGAIRWQGYWNP